MTKIYFLGQMRDIKIIKKGGGIWRGEVLYILKDGTILQKRHIKNPDELFEHVKSLLPSRMAHMVLGGFCCSWIEKPEDIKTVP